MLCVLEIKSVLCGTVVTPPSEFSLFVYVGHKRISSKRGMFWFRTRGVGQIVKQTVWLSNAHTFANLVTVERAPQNIKKFADEALAAKNKILPNPKTHFLETHNLKNGKNDP